MKKPFWMKLITCMLAGMLLVFGVLPTNLTFADETDAKEDIKTHTVDIDQNIDKDAYARKVIDEKSEGWYMALEGTNKVTNYADANYIIYEEDGVLKSPIISADGLFYLERDKTYYFMGANPDSGLSIVLTKDESMTDFYNKNGEYQTTVSSEHLPGTEQEDNASFIENFITQFLLLIGKTFYAVVCLIIGEPFSIENVIFNKYTNTRLAFFTNDVKDSSTDNKFITDSGIRDVLNDFFEVFTGITIVVYLIILVYMGIRILLGSTAEKGSKYKELILYWLEGVLILFLFPYIMKFSIQVNNAFVSFLYENKNEYISIMNNQPVVVPEAGNLNSIFDKIKAIEAQFNNGSDYMSIMYKKATNDGWLVFAICWWVMFFQILGFLVVYFKRVLVTMFLIAIFPLVMISYAIDKIGDAKSQAFDKWIKEFMLNVFVQSFHAITYVLIMSILSMLMTDPSENWLLMLIALTFVSKGDNILRGIFSLTGSADSVKGVGASLAKSLAMSRAISSVRGIKNTITNPKGLGMKVYNRAANLNQKAWDAANARTTRTEKQLELNKLQEVQSNPLNGIPLQLTATRKELEDDINDAVNILLGKKEGATDNDIRNAADKLTGYLNQTANADVQDILDNLADNLSSEERKILDNLLMQNAHINALMVGGREVNIKQNINIILSLLQKDANGNFTPESFAILNKIASSEDELKAMKLFSGGIKFNKKNIIEAKQNNNRVGNNAYFRQREEENIRRKFKGRGKAKTNKSTNKDAKSELDAIMRNSGSTLTNYSAKNTNASKKAKRTVRRAVKPGQERFSNKMQQASNQNSKVTTRKSKFKPLKQPKKPYQNVYSVNGSEGLETAKNVAGNTVSKSIFKMSPKNVNPVIQKSKSESTRQRDEKYARSATIHAVKNIEKSSSSATDYSGKVPEKKTYKVKMVKENGIPSAKDRNERVKEYRKNAMAPKQKENATKFTSGSKLLEIKRERENSEKVKQDQTINIPSDNQMSTRNSSGSTQNAGADIASRQGSAEDLQNIINTNNEKSLKAPQYTEKDVKGGNKIYWNAFDVDKGYGLTDWVLEKETRTDLANLSNSIAILLNSGKGYYTARELLDNMNFVNQVIDRYKNDDGETKYALDNIINSLDCRPEDYEAYLRVRILNDPDSVGNDKKIIEECKEYVKNTPMLSVIKDRLGYNLDDLKDNQNLKHLNSRNTDYDGIVSEQQREKVKEKYENELKRYELEKEIASLDKKIENNYNWKEFGKEVRDLLGESVLFGADMSISIGAGLGTGFLASGMSVDGKEETLSQATKQILAGYKAENDLYGGIKKSAVGFKNDVKGLFEDDLPSDKEEKKKDYNPIQEFNKPKNYQDKINDLKDKTNVKSPLFGNRNKK